MTSASFLSSFFLIFMIKKAFFSECRMYRYALWREWHGQEDEPYVLFIGLNPSTADEVQDDPTIRRCVDFCRSWGFTRMCMANLFAFRATQPANMMKSSDPIGPDNDAWLLDLSRNAACVIGAWGNSGNFMNRSQKVKIESTKILCLGLTKSGEPRHPLYIKKNQPLLPLMR